MRVLFSTTPGWGHIHPMVPLARALVDRGDDVLWATAADVCARLEKDGFAAVPAGLAEGESWRVFGERFPEARFLSPRDMPLFTFPRIFGAIRAAPMLTDLRPITADWRPALVIHDAAEFAAPVAAALVGVPSVTHAFGGLLPPERLVAADEQVSSLWTSHGLEPRPYCGSYEHLYLDIYPPSLHTGDAAHVPVRQPLRPVAFAAAGDEGLPQWIASGSRPLVYVTFGTVFNKDVALIREVVEAIRDLPLRVVVTLGPHGEPARLAPQPANVHVARYIPQTQLIPHCDVVVSHAGSGTFLAALAEGLPQLCLPQAADQFENAAACARSGAGLVLEPGAVTPEAVRGGVETLLSDVAFASAAQRLGHEIRDMPGPAEVAGILAERFG